MAVSELQRQSHHLRERQLALEALLHCIQESERLIDKAASMGEENKKLKAYVKQLRGEGWREWDVSKEVIAKVKAEMEQEKGQR